MRGPALAVALLAFSVIELAASSSCGTKVGCPLCYDMCAKKCLMAPSLFPTRSRPACACVRLEHWNADNALPNRLDDYCSEVVAPSWRSSYETLTGKTFVEAREHTRCVAIAAGLQSVVRQGCSLPTCAPQVACATFC